MKKLVIDIGNTLTKAAIFEGKEQLYQWAFPLEQINSMLVQFEQYQAFSSSILSTVRDYPDALKVYLSAIPHFIELDEVTPVPVINLYHTPASLGKDRLAAACGGQALFPNQDVLVINAGSCITYDVVTSAGEYHGGSISPGLNMRLKALHTFTGKLPLLSPVSPVDFPGKDTENSILSGALLGAVEEVDGMILRYKGLYPEASVLLSGGDTVFFENQLKSDIFAVQNIVLFGLNEILDYNV